MTTTTRHDIDDFLGRKRLALVGVSRNPKDFSRGLFLELCRRGYDMVPVNPQMTELDGHSCFSRLQDVTPPVAGALVMTPSEKSEQVVRDCAEAGITRVWLHRGAGKGAVSKAAVDFCHERGLRLIEGHCPYMFLPETPFFHRLHGFFLKLLGRYPKMIRKSDA
jgi:predicted CoA-binding protein